MELHTDFRKNYQVYDDYITNFYPGVLEKNMDGLLDVSGKLHFHNQQKVKNFKKLKELSKELMNTLSKASDLTLEISKTIERNLELTRALDLNLASSLHQTEIQMETVAAEQIKSLSYAVLSQREFVSDHLLGYFQILKHERREMVSLFGNSIEQYKNSIANREALIARKKKIVSSQKRPEWKVLKDSSPEDYEIAIQDSEKALEFFLVPESELTQTESNKCRFILKQVMYEYFNVILNNRFYHDANFGSMSKRIVDLFGQPAYIWNQSFPPRYSLREYDHLGLNVFRSPIDVITTIETTA